MSGRHDGSNKYKATQIVLLSVFGALVMTLADYYGTSERDLVTSLKIGVGIGLIALILGIGALRGWEGPSISTRPTIFQLIMFALGAYLVVSGALMRSTALIIAAIPFLGFAVGSYVLKRSLARRRVRD
jgi:hypothetical protein